LSKFCFNFDGSIAELKGFEIKRRGKLKLVQVFQEEVFPRFLADNARLGVYDAVGTVANRWLQVIDTKGRSLTYEKPIYLI
jgi:DNA polymerase epsilon subunit 1